ncbi:MAG TPA: hypothetical protein EYN06_05740 [Myxococcales bacterium]|nr:hypothetical protein [Myxococcales bacterium]HIN85965.1 hypothetical protein [Myxococcales bacterium]
MMQKTWILFVTLAFLAVPLNGQAELLPNEALVCPPDSPELDRYGYLRAISLDIRGVVPTVEEYNTLDQLDGVPDSMIDEWLASDEFAERAVRRHRALLWNNITNVNLMNASTSLTRTGGVGGIYWSRNRSTVFRGAVEMCLDEPVSYTVNGLISTKTATIDGKQVKQEGWIAVAPYWAPETTIRVCAFDAQTLLVGPDGTVCGTRDSAKSNFCGCGPDMRWCKYGNTSKVTASFAVDLDRRVAQLIKEDRPYTDLFTENRMWVNGPIVYYLRYQSELYANARLVPHAIDISALPDLAYTDIDTWVEIETPAHHAGILTSPAFLLRFQTNRARSNRFFNAFLCQPFQPPSGGIPLGDGTTLQDADLQVRDGCKYCHAILEPASSYWGRWTNNGAGYLNKTQYTPYREDCHNCALTGLGCTADCKQYYKLAALSPKEKDYLGWLTAYEFRRPEHVVNVEFGPKLLGLSATVDHRMPTCVAHKTTEWLLGRNLTGIEGAWLDELALDFVASGYRYRELIKAIVTHPVYRRVR